jgi:nonribosomal peptide synthetase protein BlmX
VQSWVALEGPIDRAALRAALAAVVARHEALRTTFTTMPGNLGLAQVVHPPETDAWCWTEHEPGPAAGDAAGVERLAGRERAALDAARGPAFRAALALRDACAATLVLTAHALVADHASLRVVCAELASALGQGTVPGTEPVQYADFAAWHDDLLGDDEHAADRAFWTGPAGLPAPGAAGCLPGAGEPARGGDARERALAIDADPRWAERAAGLGLDPGALSLTLWCVLVGRLCPGQDLAIAVECAGRSYDDLRIAVGPYARLVPLAVALDPALPLRAAAGVVERRLAAAVEHADHLAPDLPGRAGALAGVSFHGVAPADEHVAGELRLRPVREDGGVGGLLRLRAGAPTAPWLELRHALHAGEAAALARAYRALLDSALRAPATPVALLDAVAPGDAEAALRRGRGPATPSPGRAFHELFSGQARRTPARVAVACEAEAVTYEALDARSNRFARHLGALGVERDAAVLLCADRRPDLLVAILGILKAGATYVPVDPRQSPARLRLVAEESGASLVVTTARVAASVEGCPTVVIDEDWPVIARQPGRATGMGPATTAYVMYTSGTTGTPNGVMVSQPGLVNYLAWASRAYGLGGGAAVVATSIGFDLTVTGLLAPLVAGGRVVLLPDDAGLAGLASLLVGGGDYALVKVTPTHLQALAQLLPPGGPRARVRTLVVGGEDLLAEHLGLFARGARPRIVNEYGPTETVVGSTAYVVPGAGSGRARVPIGRPIANTDAHLLDARMRPVADALPGELHIGGAGVAHGYRGRPGPTAERFRPDPSGSRPGGRLYRTGDRARKLPSGDLEFLGRLDEQCKIRGVRVEPGEVAAVLATHPRVVQAAVLARRDRDRGGSSPLAGQHRLVAYVVPAGGERPGAVELAAFCAERLGEAAVPSAFVALDVLPMTLGGKLDRDALPEPAAARLEGAPFVEPRTPTEETIAGAIATVLGLERVGIDDDYHLLGGDSIRSVMVASRAQARGVDLRVADLHSHPTVRVSAAVADSRLGEDGAVETRPFSLVKPEDRERMPADVEDAFPLNLLQEGMIFHRAFAAKSAVYHAIASVRLRAPFDLDVLRMVVQRLVERHPMLRTSFDQTTFSEPLQLVHRTFADPLQFADLRGEPPQEQDARVLAWVASERERGFELDEHPLIRFMAQRLDEATFQFTYGFHHEIVDGWSEALMVTELFSHYFSVVFDEPVVLVEPTATMRDAVALEQRALATREHYEFWSDYLADATLMRLPRPDSAPRADRGEREIVRLAVPASRELSERLGALARSCAVPLKSVLLAAHMRVLSHYGGGRDTLTYTVTNGRPETADGSTAIGLFVNSLALRLRLDGGTWRDLVLATLASERASLPHRRLPMAELKRHQGNEPLAETLFFYTDYHVFSVLDRWKRRGVEHVADELYGESTFPFCAIFRQNRETGTLEIRLEYDRLQFPAELVERVGACYARVLEAIAADPGARYETYPLLSPGERAQVVERWGRSREAPATAGTLHGLVERQARAHPDRVALHDGDRTLSYRALDERANRLAHALRARGAGPEVTVGVLAEPSCDAIVAILAVLKAGSAYVPLDPGQPPARLAAIAGDAGLALVVLTAGATWAGAPGHVGTIRAGEGVERGRPSSAPRAALHPANAAYVMYTSGSTGSPKGVVVEHRQAVASTAARSEYYDEDPRRFLLVSPLSFDSSVAGVFWTLATGGTLLVPPAGVVADPVRLVAFASRTGPTHTLGIPSLLGPVLELGGGGELASLRVVIAAGEACPRELWTTLARSVPGARLFNEYGPTEASVWSTVYGGEPLAFRPTVPIGRPVGGVETAVVDDHGQALPVGVGGELLIGGTRLARGYLRRPATTAELFVPAATGPGAGARAYRSGDLARWSPSGDLEFLDRRDNQVKVRGFRVEPAEVEAALDAHPGVARAIVVAPATAGGGRTLAAYVVPAGHGVEAEAVKQFLRERLPKYMVPSSVTLLESLPLTSSGKVDRAALPAPAPAGAAASSPPGTQTEQLVAAIWRQVLGTGEPGLADDFFDLGGDSLRALQVTTQASKLFDVRLSVRALFEAPTLAAYADRVDAARSGACARDDPEAVVPGVS